MLPWYWKIIGCLVLALVGLLTVIGIVLGARGGEVDTSKSDAAEQALVGTVVAEGRKLEAENAKVITAKKEEIAAILKEKETMNVAAADIKKEIDNATSIEEIDAILKKAGL